MRKNGKNVLYWVLGLALSGLGLSLSTKSDLGLSMIGAIPYIFHVWLRGSLPWFTQGMAEYVWEAVVLAVMCVIVRSFRPRYLLSFATAVLSGLLIDLWLMALGGNGPWASLTSRIASFFAGACVTSAGIACFFRTSLPILVYELAVKEVAERFGWDKNRVKLANDVIMLALAVALSLLLTRGWTGIGVGTVVITCINAPLIALFGRLLNKLDLQ